MKIVFEQSCLILSTLRNDNDTTHKPLNTNRITTWAIERNVNEISIFYAAADILINPTTLPVADLRSDAIKDEI